MRLKTISLGLCFVFAIVSIILIQHHMEANLNQENALEHAAQRSKMLAVFRRLYSSTVVSAARDCGLKVVGNFKDVKGAIPLAVTLTKLVGSQLSYDGDGGRIQIYSPYPFPSDHEQRGLRDAFSRDAWAALQSDPDTPFYRTEQVGGETVFRYATADIMLSSCVDCHNNHPNTPKNDWKVGDLRGVIEVSVPMEETTLLATANSREFLLLIAGLSFLGVVCITIAVRNTRRSSRELEQIVRNRTADLTKEIEVRDAMEEALRDSEARTRAVVETAAEGILVIDVQGIVQSVNRATTEMFQYDKDEIVGNNISLLMPSPDSDQHDGYLANYMRSRQAKIIGIGREVTGRRKDGSTFPLHLAISELVCFQGTMFTGILHDLTERKQLEKELSLAQKLESIGQLSAGIAHEINTPMQYIGDNVEYLGECLSNLFEVVDAYEQGLEDTTVVRSWEERIQYLNDVKQRCHFDRIREQVPQAIEETLEGADRVVQIVRAMKEFSHPGLKRRALTDINAAIHSTVTISRNRWKYAADIELELDEHLPEVMALSAELKQVLLNLVVNASDAIVSKLGEEAEEKGVITIRTSSDEQNVIVEVEDSGCGIPDEIRDRVFDPFFTTKGEGKGTGQGLAIVHNVIVNIHQGSLSVESTPGVGTKFIIRIPYVLDESPIEEVGIIE